MASAAPPPDWLRDPDAEPVARALLHGVCERYESFETMWRVMRAL